MTLTNCKQITLTLSLFFTFIISFPQHNTGINLNKPERETWLQDAGFGMFIHWSFDSQLGIVISHSMVGASEDYLNRYLNELPKTFNPEDYNPGEFAVLAKLAGMKYVVFTTKHHSGFCMWDTKTTDFSITHTPYGKDIVKEYVDAIRAEGLAVGFYFSPEDFYFLHKNGETIQRRGIENISDDFRKKYTDYTLNQLRELMTNYGKIDVLFFDGGVEEVLEASKKICWELQPDILITRGAIPTPEQTLPGIPPEGAWESCITMGTQWQYKPTNENYKSGRRLIEIFIETRAKGGALLLNVGPRPNGELPIEQEENLREIAAWHFINQECVHDVRPWIVTNEENIWFTKHKEKNVVYAIITGITEWKRGDRKEFVLHSLKATNQTRVSVLGQSGERVEYSPGLDAASKYEQKDDGLHISVVKAQRIYNSQTKTDNPLVVKLENVKPALTPPAVRTISFNKKDGSVELLGELISKGDAEAVEVGFQYREYAGFGFELYNSEWKTSPLISKNKKGGYSILINNPDPDKNYQYRSLVKHPGITMYGDVKQF